MEPMRIAKQVLSFNKAAFNSGFNAVVTLQNQTEKVANNILDQFPWLPEEGRKGIQEWAAAYKKGREDLQRAANDNFKKVEELLVLPK